MTSFIFAWPILGVICAVIVLIALILTLVFSRPTAGAASPSSGHPTMWHLKNQLTRQPAVRRYHLYRRTVVSSLVIVSLLLAGTIGLSERPSQATRLPSSSHSRDIVLCLDVSGSALPFDRQVIAAYLDLVEHFRTERIGMSIFNSTSRTVFPLTNDYKLVKSQLTSSLRALKDVQSQKSIDSMSKADYQHISDWLEGTQDRKDATSLIGDGLMGCEAMVPGFTVSATTRQTRIAPASIVFATDNVLSGTPIFTLHEALEQADMNSIRVDALFTGANQDIQSAATRDLRKQITANGGTFLSRTNSDSVAGLVQSIEQQKIRQASHDQTTDVTDQPQPWILALTLLTMVLFLLLGWVRR
jgi:Ca-activated chloride channel family protein